MTIAAATEREGVRPLSVHAPGDTTGLGAGVVLTVALLAALCIAFLPLLGVGFTCDDDMFTATAHLRWHGHLRAAWVMATGHGRFYHLIIYPLAQVPFLFSSLEVVNAFRIASSLSVFVAFFLACQETFGSRRVATLFTLLAAGLFETGGSFNPFHALPLWFNLGTTLLWLAVFLFARGLARGSRSLLRWAAACFFGSCLTYEICVVYAPLFALLAAARATPGPRKAATWSALKPMAAAVALYLLLYVGFRTAYPPEYTGSRLSLAPLAEMVNTVVRFSVTGLALRSIKTLSVARHSLLPWIAGLVMGLGVYGGLRGLRHVELPSRSVRTAAAVLALVFVPNLPFALMERYRGWIRAGADHYIGSFYSGFAMAALLGLLAWMLVRSAERHGRGSLVAGALAAVLAVFAYATSAHALETYAPHRRNREVWRIAERLVGEAAQNGLDHATVIVAPTLQRTPPLVPVVYDYWSFYLSDRLGHSVKVIDEQDQQAGIPPGPEAAHLCLVSRYSERDHLGLGVVGVLDAERWNRDRKALPCRHLHLTVFGRPRIAAVAGLTSAAAPPPTVYGARDGAAVTRWDDHTLRTPTAEPLVVETGEYSVDLNALDARP